ncbi:hypothetical protein [Hydrocarboniphaga effusa]|uniref:hypothetical protein n=1 Tax=Hydrocarboniphaga effusa TaxID=243629 RepID=UPI00398BCFB8
MSKKQRTVKSAEEVRDFIENNPHYASGWEERYQAGDEREYFFIEGHSMKIRIPPAVKKDCFVKANFNRFDSRMWRWDFDAEKKAKEQNS